MHSKLNEQLGKGTFSQDANHIDMPYKNDQSQGCMTQDIKREEISTIWTRQTAFLQQTRHQHRDW